MWSVQASNQTAMMTGCGSVLWCAANPISIQWRRHFAHDLLMFCDAISRIAKSRFSRTAHVHFGFACLSGVFCLRRMAPEILLGERYNEKIDVYAFAMVLLELTSRQLPW